jgi:hypothetical protein
MKVENVFGHPIVRAYCEDESIYHNQELTSTINLVFSSEMVQRRARNEKGDSHKGAGLTTVGQPYGLIDYPGAGKLVEWVTKQLLLAREPMGLANKGNKVYYKRSWVNRLFRGGYGLCHRHTKVDEYMKMYGYKEENFRPDAVAILYVDVPEGSSNLVICREGDDYVPIDNFKEEDMYWLKPIQGELVIHSPDVWHAVSVHNSDLPRNVFVFDIDYV